MRDLWRTGGGESRLTWRLLGNLIRHLPPESATKTALRCAMGDAELVQTAKQADPSEGEWSHLEMLVASLVDAVKVNTFTMRRLKGDKKVTYPDPTPRPGVKPRGKKRQLNGGQLDLLMRRIHGARIEGEIVAATAQSVTARSKAAPPTT